MSQSSIFHRFVRDIFDLCELQMQLLSIDSQAARRQLTFAVSCMALAATLAGSALTVVMVGGGLLLGEATDLSPAGGLLVCGLAMFGTVSLLAFLALKAIRSALAAMNETKSEFAENLRWLKATLLKPESSPRNQMRRETFSDYPVEEIYHTSERDFTARSVSPLHQR